MASLGITSNAYAPTLANAATLPHGKTPDSAIALTRLLAAREGWTGQEFSCLVRLWTKESGFRYRAQNSTPVRTSLGLRRAGGIPQILGLNPKTSPHRQIERGLLYIESRYGTPCEAWSTWQARDRRGVGWY